MATVSFNLAATTSPQDSFLLQTSGFIQGLMMDDPVAYQQIRQGTIASTVTGSMYAGMAITQDIPAINGEQVAPGLVLATTVATLTGFTVGNRFYNGVVTPGSNVPFAAAGNSISFAALGSGARIAVQCDPTLANSLSGGAVNQQVAWDFTNQKLVAYTSGTALPVTIEALNSNSKIVTSVGGVLEWTVGTCALIKI